MKKSFLFLPLVLLIGGCASAPLEITRNALPVKSGTENSFFETLAPVQNGKIFAHTVGTIHLCYWQRSSTERVWMLWTDANSERVPLTSDGAIYAIYNAEGKAARLEVGGGRISYAELTRKPIYIIGSRELELEVEIK